MIFNNTKLHTSITKKNHYTYVELILFGLNYSFRRLSRYKIRFNLQYGDHFNILLPKQILGRVFKRRVVLFGNNAVLKKWLSLLMLLRYPNAHTGKGLRIRKNPYRVKPGKERKK